MTESAESKVEVMPDIDDLLQCPVCYEIPSGQIFQCNEGHHVCGRCKARLNVCPVCRALFFGTRNYAMEELIANFRKLRAFKLGGKVRPGSVSSESSTPVQEAVPENAPSSVGEEVEIVHRVERSRPPPACKGLFRCLCCKTGKCQRLPHGRLLNHLRYYHSNCLLEGKSESGEYIQAWQFPTEPGKIVTAVRVSDMGIFFLIIEISATSICAWVTMAASPWVANEFSYTVTISGNDREAIFSDAVWSVRSCEGTLRKRGHCLLVDGADGAALVSPEAINCKLSICRHPEDDSEDQPVRTPRAVLRIANRVNDRQPHDIPYELEPFLQDLQSDVARLSLAFASLGREASAIARSEAELRTRMRISPLSQNTANSGPSVNVPEEALSHHHFQIRAEPFLSRSARRRMRLRLRAMLRETHPSENSSEMREGQGSSNNVTDSTTQDAPRSATSQRNEPVPPPPVPPPSSSGPSNGNPNNGNNSRRNKKKRRQQR